MGKKSPLLADIEFTLQISHIIKNLRFPNEVRGNDRLTAVIEDTFIIFHEETFCDFVFEYSVQKM